MPIIEPAGDSLLHTVIQEPDEQPHAVIVLEFRVAQAFALAEFADVRHQLRVELLGE